MLEVNLKDETVWLNLEQMAELFQRDKSVISRYIKNAFAEELKDEQVVAKFATTTKHGAIEGKTQTHMVEHYNLDMIISIKLIDIANRIDERLENNDAKEILKVIGEYSKAYNQ